MGKTAVLIVNLGTPDSPSVSDVRSYLSQFLNDPRVIDIPYLARKMLVNLIIVPFRAPKSAKVYQEVWTEDGSPILLYGRSVEQKLRDELGDEYEVELAMRYKNPSITNALDKIRKGNPDKIIILPLFPQYASATTGSVHEEVMRIVSKWWVIPELRFVSQYWDHPGYIDSFVERGKKYDWKEYDHVLFSFHGLPTRQVDKVYAEGMCSDRDCEHSITDENKYCYKATCFATARAIASKFGMEESDFTVCFQSRLDKNWLEPFSDKIVIEQAKKGAKKLLVFSPAFVADCLETVIEIGDEYQEIFEEHGGEKVQLVESLNDHPMWISTLKDIIKKA